MRDFLFLLAFLGIILFGYYLAGRLGRSIKKHYKSRRGPADPDGNGVMFFPDRPHCFEEAEEPGLQKAGAKGGCRGCKWSSCFNHR